MIPNVQRILPWAPRIIKTKWSSEKLGDFYTSHHQRYGVKRFHRFALEK